MFSMSSSARTNSSRRLIGRFATSPPLTTTSRTDGVRAQVVEHLLVAVLGLISNLYFATWGVELPTRSMRVQCPQYWGQVGSISASTFVGYRCVRPSTAHMSASCSESRGEYGCDGHSGSRSLNAGAM